MKYILVLLLLLTGVAYGQTTYFIRADTTKLQKVGASNELVILNDTRDTLGALVNIGGGKTAFQRGRASGDTLFLGRDTIIGIGAGGGSFTPAITPPTITSNENNYNPTGLATAAVMRLDADAPWNITGIEGGIEGRTLVLHNIGSFDITLPSEDAGSTADNQFLLSSSYTIGANMSILLRYDGTSEKWRNVADVSGGVPLLFARTDTRNETDADMNFSGAGYRLNFDSLELDFTARQSADIIANFFLGGDVIYQEVSDVSSNIVSGFGVNNGTSIVRVSNNDDPTWASELYVVRDSMILKPHLGNVHIDSLDHIPNPGTNKMMVWDSATGHVATRLLPTGGGGSGTVTEVTATDANGFNFTVTDGTTTPNITLETTVSNDQLVVANAGDIIGYGSLTFTDADDVATLTVGESGGSRGQIVFQNATNSYTLSAPGSGTNVLELPTNAGTEGQVLTKGSANTSSWQDAGGISMGYSLFADTLKSGSTVLTITNRAQVNEEFISSSASSGAQGYFYDASAGTGADVSANQKTFTGNIGGIAVFTTGTTNSGAGYLASAPTYYPIDTNNYYRIGYYNLRLEDLSDGTETYQTRFGFMLGETVQNEIYFKYTHSLNSGAWTCYSENGTTAESTASGVTVAADTDYDLEIEYQGATVKFWINGTLVATHTTQVPQHANIQGIAGPYTAIIKSAGTTARVMYVDAIKVRVDHKSAVQN